MAVSITIICLLVFLLMSIHCGQVCWWEHLHINTNGNGTFLTAGTPYDGEPVQEIVTIHPALTTTMIVLAVAGATFAIACMIFNFVKRKKKSVNNYTFIVITDLPFIYHCN